MVSLRTAGAPTARDALERAADVFVDVGMMLPWQFCENFIKFNPAWHGGEPKFVSEQFLSRAKVTCGVPNGAPAELTAGGVRSAGLPEGLGQWGAKPPFLGEAVLARRLDFPGECS